MNLNKGLGVTAIWIFNFAALNSDKVNETGLCWLIAGSLIVTVAIFESKS